MDYIKKIWKRFGLWFFGNDEQQREVMRELGYTFSDEEFKEKFDVFYKDDKMD